MRQIISEYGTTIAAVVVGFLIIGIIFYVLLPGSGNPLLSGPVNKVLDYIMR